MSDVLSLPGGSPAPGEMTVAELIRMYVQLGMEDVGKDCQQRKIFILKRFGEDLGERAASQVRGIDVSSWLASQTTWKSPFTYNTALGTIRRLFNWGIEQECIPVKNPTARIKKRRQTSQRVPMSDEHFQMLLRKACPAFKRLLLFLKLTGCRPKELASIKWQDVRLEECRVILKDHKTAKKTGRPRIIPLVPCLVKMLVWVRAHRQASCVGLVQRWLMERGGRMPAAEMARLIRSYGVSPRSTLRARIALGVEKHLINDLAKGQYWEYRLPADHRELPEPTQHDYVFINSLGNPWDRSSMVLHMMRLRQRAGVPRGVILYGLRHRFFFQGVRNNVNLKLLSLAGGHSSTAMTEKYVWAAGLGPEVQEAALRINFGESIETIEKKLAVPRRLIEIAIAPPVEEILKVSEFLPSRAGCERPRPQVPGSVDGQPAGNALEILLREVLQKLHRNQCRPAQPASAPEQLKPAQEAAWKASRWAVDREPELAAATDRELFHFLQQQPDCPCKLPPQFETFSRYLSTARLFHDCRQRELHPRQEAGGPQP